MQNNNVSTSSSSSISSILSSSSKLEDEYVHATYQAIAPHFSSTRYKSDDMN